MDAVNPLSTDEILEMNFHDPTVSNDDYAFVLTVFGVSKRDRTKLIRKRNEYFEREREKAVATRSTKLDEREPLHKTMVRNRRKPEARKTSRVGVKLKK